MKDDYGPMETDEPIQEVGNGTGEFPSISGAKRVSGSGWSLYIFDKGAGLYVCTFAYVFILLCGLLETYKPESYLPYLIKWEKLISAHQPHGN